MIKEQENLILKDICARIPYGLFVYYNDYDDYYPVKGIRKAPLGYFELELDAVESSIYCSIDEVELCLFPLSSISKEQQDELDSLGIGYGEYAFHDDIYGRGIGVDEAYKFYEWCYKNHIDYLGLIDMRIAIDATGKNIY